MGTAYDSNGGTQFSGFSWLLSKVHQRLFSYCDTIDEAKIFVTKKATKKFFDEQALLVEKREAAAKQAADQKAANMAKYAARYQKRK